MSAAQFRAAVKRLRLSQAALARRLKVNVRTARRWASGESAVPEPIALLLTCWVREQK
jgi:DNA-binding transcriptional regulator YiaG